MNAGDTGIQHFEIGEEYQWRILKVYASLSDEASVAVEANLTEKDIAKYGKLYCDYAYPSNKQQKFMDIIELGPKMSNYE